MSIGTTLIGAIFFSLGGIAALLGLLAAETFTDGAFERWHEGLRVRGALRRKFAAVEPRTILRPRWTLEIERAPRPPEKTRAHAALATTARVDGESPSFADRIAPAEAALLAKLTARERAALAQGARP